MKGLFFFLITIIFSANIIAQNEYNPLQPPNTYQNINNPNYWKNKLPHPGYWQQDVHYKISANIDERTNIITGKEILTYWNNSPHDLDVVYFHLYQNAFQPDSYYDELQTQNKVKPKYGQYESQKKGTEITFLTVNGFPVKTELDNTILKIFLNEPIQSGDNVEFVIDFKTYFDNGGSVRRRMKKFIPSEGVKHFDGVHWYPRISVFDRKFGWTTDQHLGREFYGDFGCFDVELTFASNYIVEATGFLLNRDEMFPKQLKEKLDIKNFVDKPYDSPTSEIIAYNPNERKTWRYHAENVHDFAFTADPTYRIGEAEWNKIKCYSLVQEPHAKKWQNAAEYAAKTIEVFSEDIGMYTYHKIIVADARDGMEYPMITLDGGSDPGYRDLLVHEIGHMWFFGQIGNNETYRAALDEGFTQFLTAWGLEKIDGTYLVENKPKNKYKQRFKNPLKARDSEIYVGYIRDATKNETPQLNTHSDGFNGALRHGGGYGHVYYKAAAMLYNMQYVLGEELFLNAMKNYFMQWKIAHPYFEDFRNSIITYTKVDLNWFFDQWLETTKDVDYSIMNVIKNKENENSFDITLKRSGHMQMPIDLEVIDKKGETHNYHIPNQWFVKQTNAKILDKWHGWDKIYPTYTAKVTIPNGIKLVNIDPTHRLADSYMLDNSSRFPVKISFDHRIWNYPNWTQYELFIRPDIWYNNYDGFKTGIHLNGNYLNTHHVFDANIWYNTGLLQNVAENTNDHDQLSFRFNYRTSMQRLMNKSYFTFSAKQLDGLDAFKIGIEKEDRSGNNLFYLNFNSLYRNDSTDIQYLLNHISNHGDTIWGVNKKNNTITLGIKHYYKYFKGNGKIDVNLKSSSFQSDYNYAQLQFTSINNTKIDKLVLKSRVFMQIGTGNAAPESQVYLSGANPEEMMENKYTRSNGLIPESWLGYDYDFGHFHYGGGLNIRSYSSYLSPDTTSNGIYINGYKGSSGAAINLELEFDRYINLFKKIGLNSYLFGDIGILNIAKENKKIDLGEIRADAGIGFSYTNTFWGPLEKIKPLTIRIDFPFFVNRLPPEENYHFDFRWIIGINRAF